MTKIKKNSNHKIKVRSVDRVNENKFIFMTRKIRSTFDKLINVIIFNTTERLNKPNSLEITTRIGCRNMCKFCPQKLLIKSYYKSASETMMTLDTFKQCLKSVPLDTRIDFSGMAEPWLNPDCTDMILYTHKMGYKNIAIYTTCVGMTEKDIQKIESVKFCIFCVHLPDGFENTRIEINKQYISTLKYLKKSKIKNIKYMAMGSLHPKLSKLITEVQIDNPMNTRGGNVEILPEINLSGPIKCRLPNRLHHNVLLPNGDVILCCMDYGMTSVLGNLLKKNYDEIFLSKQYQKVINLLRDDSKGDLICRHCERAIPDYDY